MNTCPHCGAELPEIVIPNWYEILRSIGKDLPPFEHCDAYLAERGISDELAEETAISIKAEWGGKGWKYKDLWSVLQTWCRMRAQRERQAPSQGKNSKYY